MAKQPARLSPEEIEIFQRGREDPNIISDYFFRQKGAEKGWIFDEKFDPEGAWQKTLHMASQRRVMIIGGFGSGKTRGVAISACVWAMTTLDFAFMNCAPVSWQSELMYNFILSTARNTPFERLIWEKPKRPYPRIELRFYVEDTLVVSTMEFMSVDKNASQILSWEGDWVNIDEAGLLDDLTETLRNLGSRMRGSVNGRERLGRLSMTSNSWDNPELWYRFDLAASLPDDYLSLVVSTRHNHNVTPEQLRLMLKDIPEDEHDRWIDGGRPEGKGNYFNKSRVYACEDQQYGDYIVAGVKDGLPGYAISSVHGAGVVYFTVPKGPASMYAVLGDPGTGDAPNRNAPAIMVWDVTDFPQKCANMVSLWWGSGKGQISPFIQNLLRFMAIYDPVFTGVDATGPQKNTNELLNTYLLGSRGSGSVAEWIYGIDFEKITNKNVYGLDFSGLRKAAYLIAGRMMIEARLMIWPKFVVGMRGQLTNYEPEKDKAGEPKIPQDLVATFCMSAHSLRGLFRIDPSEYSRGGPIASVENPNILTQREIRLPALGREVASPVQR